MNTHLIRGLFLISSLAVSGVLYADDAVEAVATQDLTFEKPDNLIMKTEKLTISNLGKGFYDRKFLVDVDFNFINTSNQAITRKIAFILPPVQCKAELNSMWNGLESEDQHNTALNDFTLTVDGKPTAFTQRTEAKLNNQNITALLKELNIPLNPCLIKFADDGYPDKQYRDVLIKHHLLDQNHFPLWVENIYFEWTQTFPANQLVNIHHQYTPVAGSSVPSSYTKEMLTQWVAYPDKSAKLIWSKNLEALADAKSKSSEMRYCVVPSWVAYHLSTVALWKGGVGRFELIIKDTSGGIFAVNNFAEQRDDQLIRKQLKPDETSFTIDNLTSAKDVKVLFLAVPQTAEDGQYCQS